MKFFSRFIGFGRKFSRYFVYGRRLCCFLLCGVLEFQVKFCAYLGAGTGTIVERRWRKTYAGRETCFGVLPPLRQQSPFGNAFGWFCPVSAAVTPDTTFAYDVVRG